MWSRDPSLFTGSLLFPFSPKAEPSNRTESSCWICVNPLALAWLEKNKPGKQTKKYLLTAYQWLKEAIGQKPDSLYLQVWLSQMIPSSAALVS